MAACFACKRSAGVGGTAGGHGRVMETVTHDPDRTRFEEGTAYLIYRRGDDTLDIRHTVVPEEASGQGIGGELVRAAVGYAREEGLALVLTCDFARSWVERHPELAT